MHPSEITGRLLDYYETHIQPNLNNQTQLQRTISNLIGELDSAIAYLPPLRHGVKCIQAGEEITASLRAGTNPTEDQVYTFKAELRQMDMAAKLVPPWFDCSLLV